MTGRTQRQRAVAFVTWAMRAGYATRGVIYGVMGGIALFVGLLGGHAAGLLGSIRWIGHLPGQAIYLIILALGMIAYTIWRGGDAVVNLAGHNPHATGWVVRGGHFFIGLLYVGFAWYALRVAFTQSGGGGLGSIFQSVMGNSIGRWFVVVVGFGTLSFGFFSIYKGATRRFCESMRESRTLAFLSPVFALGLIVRGTVIAVMGGLIIWSGWTYEPQQAGGFGQTLRHIHEAWYGRTMLAIVGVGLLAFSAYLFGEAVWRVIPRSGEKAVGRLADRV